MKIIVGLGNPGEKYLKTRHNLGFMVIDRLAQQLEMECSRKKFQSLFCKKSVEQEKIVLLKPQTFMNLSGIAVKEAVDMYKCSLQDLVVICDDLDMPPGKIRIRRSGGCGGHRGLESIADRLGSTDFSRLRVGIGRPANGDPSDYVLSAFSKEEELLKEEAIEDACQALKTWMFEGVEACMNKFN
ncbi:MAG TPA: aminoacyl-tRNA hydrolase [Candidatus Wunengus sp. YC60]|uniref:aminoacyl-tRNA hydrolase n=1 Tax=Candidatus Wunengus sp. YC60 TaxID=3367697 RepID=UPI00402544E8